MSLGNAYLLSETLDFTSTLFDVWAELHNETLASDGSFDVSSISQDYGNLIIFLYCRSTINADSERMIMTLNNDTTTTNYNVQELYGTTTTPTAYSQNNNQIHRITGSGTNPPSTLYSFFRIFVPQYATSIYKIVESCGGGYQHAGMSFMYWNSTNAINRIAFAPVANNFKASSSLRIYGTTQYQLVYR